MWFYSRWNKEKKNEEKRVGEETGMGYCPFSSLGRNTAGCVATGRARRDRYGAGTRQGKTRLHLCVGVSGSSKRHGVAIRPSACATRLAVRATRPSAHATWFCLATRFLCRDRGQQHDAATRDTTLRHGTTARGVRATRSWVCALCTQPSFETVHCLGPLFGSLFMDIVHRV